MSASSHVRIAVIAILISSSPAWAGKHTPEQIQKAIKELGDRNFNVRERASRLLWEAGADAEAPLQEALKGGDAETTRRAKALLDKFAWGIFPDTPPEVVEQINRYRDGDRNVRLQVVAKLIGLGQPGYAVVKRLADTEKDPAERQALYSKMAENAQRGVPGLLVAGNIAAVEELLDRCLLSDSETAYTNFAAYHYLRGTVDQAIARASAEWAKTRSKITGTALVHLYRVKPDFGKALAIAREMSNDALAEQVLWEQGNWRALTERARKEGLGPREASTLGMKAAIARLDGDSKIFDAAVAELTKMTESDDRFELRSACEALLLVGKYPEALAVLVARKRNAALTFDLLAARMQYTEAFALAHEAKLLDKDEQFALDLRRARLLYQLGERDQSLQLFAKLSGDLKELGEITSARDLVKTMARLGLKAEAGARCAAYMATLQKQGVAGAFAQLLEPLYGSDKDAADLWWTFLRTRSPFEEPDKTMKTLRMLFDGKPMAQRGDWARGLAALTAPLEPAPIDQLGPDANAKANPAVAAAIVMERAKDLKKAEEYFNKAVAVRPETASFIELGDFLGRQGRFPEADKAFERAAKTDPANPLALFLRGWALLRGGKEKEGKRLMELAHWIPLGIEQDRGSFARELDRRGFAEHARRERDLVLNAGWYRYWHVGNILDDAGRVALRNKDYDRAIAYYEKAIVGSLRMGASFLENHSYLTAPQSVVQVRIRRLLAEKKFDDAVRQVRDSLKVLPGNIDILIVAIPALDRAGKKKEADELFEAVAKRLEKAAEAYPNSGFIHNSYAWLAVNCRRELDKAQQHAQKAVNLSPKGADYLDTLAEIYFRKGEVAKATETMKKCIELDPAHTYFRKQLARFEKGDISSQVPENEGE